MKILSFALLLTFIGSCSVSAQGKIASITLTVSDDNDTNTMPIQTFSYDFNKYDLDTLNPTATKTAMVMISCQSIPSFIYKAASGSMSHTVSAVLTCYGAEGEKQKIIQLSKAVINELSEPFGEKEAEMGGKTIVIRSGDMKIDAVQL